MDPLKGIFIKRHAHSVQLKHKVAVLFVSADPGMKDQTYDLDYRVEEGLPTVRVYYNNSVLPIPVVSSAIKFFRYRRSCRMGIEKINKEFGIPDLSHIHVLSRTFFPAHHYKKHNKVPYVITEQWSGYLPEDGSYKGFFKKWLTRKAVRTASAVTAVSESLRDAMLGHGLKNEYSVIPNVVDISRFFVPAEKKRSSPPVLLTVADMDDRAKNISGTLRTMKKLSEAGLVFEYRIIGGGEDFDRLKKMAADYGLLDKQVFFYGPKRPEEVAEAMRAADVFILFSNYDNMPCVITEAFASGVPVIGSALHGMKEHIRPGLGILVSPGNEEELFKAIQRVTGSLDTFDRTILRKYAEDNFSYEAVSRKFDEVYKKAIAN